MAKKENLDETPFGGVSTKVFYLDRNGEECKEEDAVEIVIHEYDEEGFVISTVISRKIESDTATQILE